MGPGSLSTVSATARPATAERLSKLGLRSTARNVGRAAKFFRRSLCLEPADAADLLRLAEVVRLTDAAQSLLLALRASRLDPRSLRTEIAIGLAALSHRTPARAVAAFRRALALAPDVPTLFANLIAAARDAGADVALRNLCRRGIALTAIDRPLRQAFAVSLYSLGTRQLLAGHLGEAKSLFCESLRVDPESPAAWENLGIALVKQGLTADALEAQKRALALKPDSARLRFSLAHALLLLGRYEAGFEAYEWRHRGPEHAGRTRHFETPEWSGSDLRGRTLLIHSEQGLGDTLQFIRYADTVARSGGRILLECPGPLAPLMAMTRGDWILVQRDTSASYDVHVHLASLPRTLATGLRSVPQQIPYLRVDSALIRAWSRRMGAGDALKIGLIWSGEPSNPENPERAIALRYLGPLLSVPNCRFFALQVGPARRQLEELRNRTHIVDLGVEFLPFADTAAVIAQLDLLISVDTSMPHLAGALGRPVWLFVKLAPDWRWLLRRRDSPWYPSFRLFRQERHGDWSLPVSRAVAELSALAKRAW